MTAQANELARMATSAASMMGSDNRIQKVLEGTDFRDFAYKEPGNLYVPSWSAGAGWAPGSFTPASPSWFDGNNRMVNAALGIQYDAAGNQTAIGGFTFAYDTENRLVSSTLNGVVTTYAYDGEGRRVKKSTGGSTVTFVYDAFGRLAAEYGGTADPVGTEYLTADHLGSTRLITSSTGAERRCLDYLPFGEQMPQGMGGRGSCHASANEPRLKFTGKERDQETGLDYFGARYYSGAQGRFTSADEPFLDQSPDDPQSWNLYSYVRNNPLRFIDPTGQACVVRSDGSEYDDDSGGQSCADVKKDNKNLKPSATVTGEAGNVAIALALNTFFALDNAANDYFRFLTDAMGVQPSYMQNTPTNAGVTGNVAAAAVFVGTTLNPRGLLTDTRTRLLQSAQNPKLRNIIGNLYRPGATVGSGGTADAIRSELATGVLLSPKGHFLKGVESQTALQRLYRDPSLNPSDRQIVKELLIELQNALSGR
ncbi:MAG: RHS repeat domain-containing protein [Bryobacteraceae bacterium]